MVEYKHEEQVYLVMQEIIKCLKNMGGGAYRKEVIQELRENPPSDWEDWMEFVTISKTGQSYKDFEYRFGFAVTNLEIIGAMNRPKRGYYELTEKGRSINADNFPTDEIKAITALGWDKRAKLKNEKKKDLSLISDAEENFIKDEEDQKWEQELITALKSFTPQKFEIFSRALVRAMGVDIDEKIGVKVSGDGGLDGFGYVTAGDFRTSRVAIQAKRWEGTVGSVEIDKFRGAMDKFNAEFGIFITTSTFTRQALEASRTGTRVITLIDGEKIVDLVAKFQLYVTPVTTYELGDFYKVAD